MRNILVKRGMENPRRSQPVSCPVTRWPVWSKSDTACCRDGKESMRILKVVGLWMAFVGMGWAQSSGPVEAQLREDPKALAKVTKEDPTLPRVLILGDSISIGYTVPVRELLRHKANVQRPGVNCQDTVYGLANIRKWVGTNHWDVIHFNWGIWDTHYVDGKSGGLVRNEAERAPGSIRLRRTPAEYGTNLTQLVKILQGTGAKLIWASTTPVLHRKGDRFEDIVRCNTVAAQVMREQGVTINDLYSSVLPKAVEWQEKDQVHFNSTGNRELAKQVAGAIETALRR